MPTLPNNPHNIGDSSHVNDHNLIVTALSGAAYVTSGNIADVSGNVKVPLGAWTSYTPTVSAGSGTATTYTATGRYIQIGKTVHVRVAINVTNKGTAASYIKASLPVTVNTSAGIDPTGIAANTGLGVSGVTLIFDSGNFTIWKYDGTTMWANNPITASITYEAA